MADKTEKPTKKKLDDSKKKGQVAQSPNVAKVMACAALLETALATRGIWISHLQDWITHMLTYVGFANDRGGDTVITVLIGAPILTWAAIFCLVAMGVAIVLALVGNVMQTGFMVAPEALVPDLERINPLSHLKQMFSMEKVMELITNLFKVVVIGACTVYAIYGSFDQLVYMAQGPIDRAAEVFVGILQRTERMALIALLLFAAVDWAMKKHFFMEQMKMEKEEIKREQKDQYGDPHMRSHRKKMSKELLQGSAAQRTRRANAVVTNPTHFAVALRYHPDEAPLPVVMARGADAAAQAMINAAREAGIPIIRSIWLARTLYSVGREGRMIPSVAVKATAAVYSAIIAVLEKGGEFDYLMEVETGER